MEVIIAVAFAASEFAHESESELLILSRLEVRQDIEEVLAVECNFVGVVQSLAGKKHV
jgi:hypothetical protein